MLRLTHFGTPKPQCLGLHIQVEQGRMWPTAGVSSCDGTLPAAHTKSINRCVVTLPHKHRVMSQM